MPDRANTTTMITAAAREQLEPLGLRQRGRSRLWFADHGWWLITVEFSPSRADGTFLHVAGTWLWHQHDAWSLDEGSRTWWRSDGTFCLQPPLGEPGWTSFLGVANSVQFAPDLGMLADIARQRVEQLRTQFPDPAAVAQQLTARTTREAESPWWHAYHTAAAAALSGDAAAARLAFRRIVVNHLDPDWAHDLADQAQQLDDLVERPAELQQRILELIQATRQRLQLSPLTGHAPSIPAAT